jgi:formylglycine-generating enzyme required for sulfatase activity
MVSHGASEAMRNCLINAKSILSVKEVQDIEKIEHLVAEPFMVGKNEVTNEEYCVFLSAVANRNDPHGLYNTAMQSDINAGIVRTGKVGAYVYTVKPQMANHPIVYVSWFDAARYANWLSNGSPAGSQDKATTEDGVYALNGAIAGVGFIRNVENPNTKKKPVFWLLSESEWYTSAYLKSSKLMSAGFWSYPTQSDLVPDVTLNDLRNLANYGNIFDAPTEVGFFSESPGPFGTLDQGGNVREWTESVDSGQYRIIRGGSWADSAEAMKASESDVADPTLEDDKTGFRIGGAP